MLDLAKIEAIVIASWDAMGWMTLIDAARTDFVIALKAWRLWSKFAWYDMLARYRRSWVGPLWIALSAIIFIAALGLVYGALFQQPLVDYIPFIAVGIACWTFISAVAVESAVVFVEAENYIRETKASLFIYVFRVLWRNVLVFLHQFVVALCVLVLFDKIAITTLPLAVLGLLLLFAQAIWIIPLLGLVGTRYRDLQPIITNLLQVLLFVTPIIWLPSALGSRRWIADINPLSSIIGVVREPLLGTVPPLGAYIYVVVMLLAGSALAALCYGRFRGRIVYWL